MKRREKEKWNCIPERNTRDAIFSVSGGVFEKGSLATGRNTFNSLSDLVRTPLAFLF
jgi:hypothetical protein